MSQVPLLVGWISGSQDLLAILFLLLALHSRLQRQDNLALVATAAGLLCKETTLAFIPILIAFDWIAGRRPYRIARHAARYGILVLVWAAIHPGVRSLVAHGFRRGVGVDYLGVDPDAGWLSSLWNYCLTVINLPFTGLGTPWPANLSPFLAAGGLIVIVGLSLASKVEPKNPERAGITPPRAALLASLLAFLPILLTAVIVRRCAPYYAVIASLGGALLLGVGLSRLRSQLGLLAILAYLALGVWSRGMVIDSTYPSERNFNVTSAGLAKVEHGFKTLRPSLPPDTQAVVSVQAVGAVGAYHHLHALQALKVWYNDPSITTVRLEQRRPPKGTELFFVVTPELDVTEIDLTTLEARSSRGQPRYAYCERALRGYALGLFASGEVDRAAVLLYSMPAEGWKGQNARRRLAAALLLASGRKAEAEWALRSLRPLDREYVLPTIRTYLAEPIPGHDIDAFVLEAFGISESDRDAARYLLDWYSQNAYYDSALRFARRLQRLDPADPQTGEEIRRLSERIAMRDRRAATTL